MCNMHLLALVCPQNDVVVIASLLTISLSCGSRLRTRPAGNKYLSARARRSARTVHRREYATVAMSHAPTPSCSTDSRVATRSSHARLFTCSVCIVYSRTNQQWEWDTPDSDTNHEVHPLLRCPPLLQIAASHSHSRTRSTSIPSDPARPEASHLHAAAAAKPLSSRAASATQTPDGAPAAARLRRAASRPRGPGGVPAAPSGAAAAAARGRRLFGLLRSVRRGGVVVPGRPRLRDRGRAQRPRHRSRHRHQVHRRRDHRREGTCPRDGPSPSAPSTITHVRLTRAVAAAVLCSALRR